MKISLLCPISRTYSSLFGLLLIFILFQKNASAQNNLSYRVAVTPQTLSVKSILEQIEAQSGLSFVYSRSYASVDKVITLDQANAPVKEVLKQINEKTNLEFTANGRQVVVREKSSQVRKTGRVSGKVTEKETGQPLEAVTVTSGKGHTLTDSQGNFTLAASEGGELVFSYVGMRPFRIALQDLSEPLAIELEGALQQLEELVVTGYQTQKKADLTGAVSVVNVDDIRDIPLGNPLKAMQGRVPGMMITGDGSPNGSMTVRIRGIGTMNNNDPLYVIDGIPTKRGLQELNPNDIESIQVLKDASSATIYGSRAANGVIIITTRRAKRRYSRIDADVSTSVQYYANNPERLNTEERGKAYWIAALNDRADPNLNSIYQYDWNNDYDRPVLNRVLLPEYLDAAKTMRPADTDWFKEVTRVSTIRLLNLSVSSGSEKGSAMFSLSYYDNKGILRESRAQKITARLNTDYSLFNHQLKIGENFSVNYVKSALTDNALFSALIQHPIVPIHTIDGGWGGPVSGMTNTGNPVLEIENSKQNKNHFFRVLGNAYADWMILPNLFFKTSIGVDFAGNYRRTLRKSYVQGYLRDPTNQVQALQNYDGNIVFQNTLTYSMEKGSHRFDWLLGHEQIKYIFQEFIASRQGYALENIDYAYMNAGASNQTNAGSGYGFSLLSYFGKLNYTFADRYLASFTLRRDGSSRFGKNNRYGTFPAFSVGWRVSKEAFLKELPVISDLKLRYGWGKNGNQEIANNAAYSLYAAQYTTTGYDVTGTSYDLAGNGAGQLPSGFRLIQLGNDALKWENTTQSNFGLDFEMFENRLSGSVDYFVKKSTDILIRPPYLGVIGEGGDKWYNGASMENKGLEILLSYKGTVFHEISYSLTGNIAGYRNKVTYLPSEVLSGYPGNGTDKTILGRPRDVAFGYVTDGLFQSQSEVDAHAQQPGKGIGRIRYKDLNGDGLINYLDRDYIANYNPDFTYGFNAEFTYRNFDLSFFFQGVQGVDTYNGNKNFSDFASANYANANWGTRTLKAWSPQNTGSAIPALTLVDRNNEARTSTYYVENGSYLKLRNLQIGYNFQDVLKPAGVQNARVYFQASNLFMIKSRNYTATDPEVYQTAFPIPSVMTLGANFSF